MDSCGKELTAFLLTGESQIHLRRTMYSYYLGIWDRLGDLEFAEPLATI